MRTEIGENSYFSAVLLFTFEVVKQAFIDWSIDVDSSFMHHCLTEHSMEGSNIVYWLYVICSNPFCTIILAVSIAIRPIGPICPWIVFFDLSSKAV